MSQNESNARASDWRSSWAELRDVLSDHGSNFELYHGVLMTEGGSGSEPQKLVINRYKSNNEKLVKHIVVPLEETATEEHFFYADSNKTFDLFQQELIRMDRLLLKVPVSLAPRTHTTGLAGRIEDALIRWIRLMFFLSWRYPKHTLMTELYCTTAETETLDGISQFVPYEEASLIDSEFEPKEVLFSLDQPSKHLANWRQKVRARGGYFPSMFAAHFTKELFYASANGIDILLQEAAKSDHKPKAKPNALTKTEEDRRMLFLSILRNHHNQNPSGQTEEALSREAISAAMKNLNPARVTELAKQVFGSGGFRTYKRLCDSGQMAAFLVRQDCKEFGERLRKSGVDFNKLQPFLQSKSESEEESEQ